jgi:hypothetical protein
VGRRLADASLLLDRRVRRDPLRRGEPVSAEGDLLWAADLDGDWDAFDVTDE